MTLLFLESFEQYDTSLEEGQMAVRWHSVNISGISTLIFRTGTRSVSLVSTSHALTWITPTVYTGVRLYTGVATRMDWGGSGTWVPLISYNYGRAINRQLSVEMQGTTKHIRITTNDSANVLQEHASSFANIDESWVYFEFMIGAVEGIYELRMNGTTLMAGEDVTNPEGLGIDRFTLHNGGGSVNFDNVYVCDGNGFRNNTFLAKPSTKEKIVTMLKGNSDGHLIQWNRSAGSTNAENVDEDTPDNDSTYVYGDANNEEDFYGLENITVGIPSDGIDGVQVSSWSANNNETDFKKLRHSIYSGGQTSYGTVVHEPGLKTQTSPGTGNMYGCYDTIFETLPGGGNFTPTNVDGLEVGQKMEAL